MDPISSPPEEKEDTTNHGTNNSSSPAFDREYIYVADNENGSDIGSLKSIHSNDEKFDDAPSLGKISKSCGSSISSFTDVHIPDIEPKLEKDDNEQDVSALLEEAISSQHDGLCQMTSSRYPQTPPHDSLCQMTSTRYPAFQPDIGLSASDGTDSCRDEQDGSRRHSEYEDIDATEAETGSCQNGDFRIRAQSDKEMSSSSGSTSPDTNNQRNRSSSEGEAKDACVLFHGITYLGSATVNAPVSEIELKRTISIMRDHAVISIDVILAIGLAANGLVRLVDPVSRTDIASYNSDKICFWGKGDEETREKDSVAFNVSHGEEEMFHCHVFKCEEEDAVRINCFFDS